jgi:TolA-binding protein
MRVRLSVIFAACLLVLASWPLAARAQPESREAIALQNQIYQLRQEIESLRAQVANGASGSSLGSGYQAQPQSGGNDMVTQLLSRVSTLDDQVRELRGRVDELQNDTQQKLADLNKQIGDLKFQMQNPGAAAAGGTPGALPAGAPTEQAPPSGPLNSPPPAPLGTLPAQPQGYQPGQPPSYSPQNYQPQTQPQGYQPGRPTPLTQPAAPPVRRTPEVAMHDGYAALAHRDYAAAASNARDVLSNYRTSPRAYDAQFLLAQALAGEHQYSQAAIAYDDTYNRNRKGGHAAPALLGLASSLAAINEKRAACETLVKLHAEFPQSATELRVPIASVRQRAGCQ